MFVWGYCMDLKQLIKLHNSLGLEFTKDGLVYSIDEEGRVEISVPEDFREEAGPRTKT